MEMQVRTYDVVPISPSLGMVAFVEGTKPLKALLTDPALIPPEAVAAADDKYARFILSKGGNLERPGMAWRAQVSQTDSAMLFDNFASITKAILFVCLTRSSGRHVTQKKGCWPSCWACDKSVASASDMQLLLLSCIKIVNLDCALQHNC